MQRIASFFLLIAVLLFSGKRSSADDFFMETFHKGFGYVYNFEFRKADSLVSILEKKYPQEYRSYILGANYYWWKIRSGDTTPVCRRNYSVSLDKLQELLDKKKEVKKIGQDEIFYYINLYSYRSRIELLDNNYIKALSYMTKCNAFITLSANAEDSYEPFNLTSGLYNCFMAMAKKNNPLLAPYFLFAPSCDKEKGLKQLGKCTVNSDFLLSTEANYFLMIFYGEGDIDYSLSASYAEKLSLQYPNNLLYQYYLFKVKLLSGNLEQAMKNLILLFQKSRSMAGLNEVQRKYFTDMAGKDMMEYCKKHPTEKPEN